MSFDSDIKLKLDKISSKLNILEGKDGMIKLDKNNKGHVDWYEDMSTGCVQCLNEEQSKLFLKNLEYAKLNAILFKDCGKKLKEILEELGL